MGSTAVAQQPRAPVRERQERQVVVPSGPHEPVPEVRVAAKVPTYLRFNASIDRDSLQVEGRATHFTRVDAGEYTLTLETAVEPEPGEKLEVRVRYRGGGTPAYATLVLVSHPTLVDKDVEVVRRQPPPETLEAELAALRAESAPARLVFSGRLDPNGVQAQRIRQVPGSAQGGLKVAGGEGYHASAWALAVVRVHNLPEQQPWEPGEARLTRTSDGKRVKVRSVDLNKARLAPGEEGLVAVETEAPFWTAGEVFRLELLDKSGGRLLLIPEVKL
jgi:uncharacterized protein (TIGR02268 family)